jgi:hypothetical protein
MKQNMKNQIDEEMNKFYDSVLLDALLAPSPFLGEPRYRKERVPVYLKIKVPVIHKHTCYNDYEEYDDEPIGWLISFKEVKLFKIGSKIEEVPYWPKRKTTGETIKFKRYEPLTVKEKEPLERK